MQVTDERRYRPDKYPDNVRRFSFDSEEIQLTLVSNGEKIDYELGDIETALEHYLNLRKEGIMARLTITTNHETVNCTTAIDSGVLIHDVIRTIRTKRR